MVKRYIGVCVVALSLVFFAGCGSPENDGNLGQRQATGHRADVVGNIKIAIPEWNVTDLQVQIGNFLDSYPNVRVEFDTFVNPQEYLTAQANAGDMPDLLTGDWDSLPFSVSQGWVHPLDDFAALDDEVQYVPEALLNNYRFLGKLYAYPHDLQFPAIVINLDLLDQLNMDKPSYDWTIDEFTQMLRAATTATYSGTERLWGLDVNMVPNMNREVGYTTYSEANNSFSFATHWQNSLNLFQELRSYPGLEAWNLRNSNVTDDSSDYIRKFGSGDTSDSLMAFKAGFTLMDCALATWDASWLRYMNFNWELYPLPIDDNIGHRQLLHANHSFMLAGAKEPTVTYELLRWLTIGVEGNLTKMDLFNIKDATDVVTGYLWFFPSTLHPDVKRALEQNPYIQGGALHLYENMGTAVRADLYKIVPGYAQVTSDIIEPVINEIRNGLVDANATAAEIDTRANRQLSLAMQEFNARLEVIQREFDERSN